MKPIFRLHAHGHVRFYNTANHPKVVDEQTARDAFLDDTGYEAYRVSSYSFDELSGVQDFSDFVRYGL